MADGPTVDCTKKSRHNVFDVAHYILETIGGEVPTVKLQKLCYYAQAWHLAKYGTELFPEEFEKWRNGPVCRELYRIHRGRGSIGERDISPRLLHCQEFVEDEYRTLEYVFTHYAPLESDALITMTHEEDPWKNAGRNSVIDRAAMEKYYFDQWERDFDDGDCPELTAEDIQRELDAPEGPTYNGVAEIFRATQG